MNTVGPIVVTAAVIEREDRILIAQRKADSVLEALKWEFPGGKLEAGESPEECLVREIREELGLQIKVGALVGISSHVYRPDQRAPIHILLLCYRCEWVAGEAQRLEVNDFCWIEKRNFAKFDFAAADIPFLPLI